MACKAGGPGPRGVLLLEPLEAAPSAGAGAGAAGAGAGADSPPPPPGWRLLMLAERTPKQMLQVGHGTTEQPAADGPSHGGHGMPSSGTQALGKHVLSWPQSG